MIMNKKTKDFYIGSASTNRFFIRFKNHLIHLTGSKIACKFEISNLKA